MSQPKPILLIEPNPEGFVQNLQALWKARRLVYWLVWRDLTLRYRQTAIGFFWAALYPAALFGVYLFSLGYLAKVPLPDNTPYSIYILTGLVPWLYFQNALMTTANALQQNMHLISKIYFPRLVLLLTGFVVASFDFAWMILVLIVVALCYGLLGFGSIGTILLWSLAAGFMGMSLGIIIASLSIYYKDIAMALPVILQVAFFLSPVVYATHLIPERFINWYYFNPATAIIESFRDGFGLKSIVGFGHQATALFFVAFVFVLSLVVFNRVERELVDRM